MAATLMVCNVAAPRFAPLTNAGSLPSSSGVTNGRFLSLKRRNVYGVRAQAKDNAQAESFEFFLEKSCKMGMFDSLKTSNGLLAGLGLGALGSAAFSPEAEAAVQEIAQVADSDSRGLILLLVLAPAIGWVLFNILQPALNQLNKMTNAKGLVGAVGLGAASMLVANQADAAVQEITQIADNDSRGLVLLLVLLPAVGWVLFNILQPALNQLNKMRGGAKGLAGAIGLSAAAASLLSAPDADAAQEMAQIAADSRPLILGVVLLPAIGWVLFNILRPALNQFNKMKDGK